jgi:ABC-2 type transport system permease protein
MFLIGSIAGKTRSFSEAAFHIILLAGGGLLFFAIALLVSSLVEGEYTAPVVSYGVVIAIAVAFSDRSLRAYNPWAFIVGSEYYDRHTALLVGPIPWMNVAVYVLLAALLTVVSVKLIQRREF